MSNSNDIAELRKHLFDTLRGLKDGSVEIEQAKAMREVAGTIIESAKVEVDYMRVTGGDGTGFIQGGEAALPAPAGPNVRVHKLR